MGSYHVVWLPLCWFWPFRSQVGFGSCTFL